MYSLYVIYIFGILPKFSKSISIYEIFIEIFNKIKILIKSFVGILHKRNKIILLNRMLSKLLSKFQVYRNFVLSKYFIKLNKLKKNQFDKSTFIDILKS